MCVKEDAATESTVFSYSVHIHMHSLHAHSCFTFISITFGFALRVLQDSAETTELSLACCFLAINYNTEINRVCLL